MVTDLLNGTGGLGYPPLYGKDLKNALNHVVTRQFRFAFEFEELPTPKSFIEPATEVAYGSLYADPLGIPRPVVNYEIMDTEMTDGCYVVDAYAQVAGNASKGIQGVAPKMLNQLGTKNFTQVQTEQPGTFSYQDQQYQFRGAGHIFGTTRMGDDSTDSVVNWQQRSWDHANLFIVGCGVFPTTGTANPTLTAAALALWAADTIQAEIQQGGRLSMCRFLLSLSLCVLAACAGTGDVLAQQTFYQVGPVISLLNGVYDGQTRVAEIRTQGGQGLGTWDKPNGEGLIVDGVFYQVLADGSVATPPDTAIMPFA
ncbi:MAG: hypothetical protein DRR06_00550 [Gammaproteobacteria bacterium]|nr:MAG: hypothetical protein DRQ54_05700 [Gammaproteobacteria bacterium]RLA48071.1 MAG: hypothetical protein DRR06_00550 [Gammaproteobacteria bacterium]